MVILLAVLGGLRRFGRGWVVGFGMVFLSVADPRTLLTASLLALLIRTTGLLAGVGLATLAFYALPASLSRRVHKARLLNFLRQSPRQRWARSQQQYPADVATQAQSQLFDRMLQTVVPVATEPQLLEWLRLMDQQQELQHLTQAVAALPASQGKTLQAALPALAAEPEATLARLYAVSEQLRATTAAEEQAIYRVQACLKVLRGLLPAA